MQGHIWREVGVGGKKRRLAWRQAASGLPLQWQNNQEWQEHISNLGYTRTLFSYPSPQAP